MKLHFHLHVFADWFVLLSLQGVPHDPQNTSGVVEPLVDKLCNELGECQAEIRRLRAAYEEFHGEHEMLCDSVESVQWGVIHLGGYTYFEALTREQRARMHSVERV